MLTQKNMLPSADELISDLRRLRLQGLLRLRHLKLDALERAVAYGDEHGVETLLRAAVDALGPGKLSQAADFTLGLTQGTRDWPAQDRRRRAAEVYGVSVERFRKSHEHLVLEQVAEQVLARVRLVGAQVPAAPAAGPEQRISTFLEYAAPGGGAAVAVHALPIELVHDVDICVSPSNLYFETARVFGGTVAGALRRAAGRRDAAGRIVEDVVQLELGVWVAAHGGAGTAFQAGSVAATSAGALRDQGIRRIYHVAVAVPGDVSGYRVDDRAVVEAVRVVFAAARQERDDHRPPLGSICFPLIGAGRGGLLPEDSIRALWWALREELRRDPGWSVHFALRSAELAGLVVRHLLAEGASSAP